MNKLYIFLTFLLLTESFFAQVPYSSGHASPIVRLSSQNPLYEIYLKQYYIEESNKAMGEDPNSIENIEGSPYADENFVEGKVYINGKLNKKDVFLRYNIYAEEIEIKNTKHSTLYEALYKDPEIYASIGGTIYIFAPYEDSTNKGGYFALIQPGTYYTLYEKSTITFKSFEARNAYRPSQPAKFIKGKDYYLVTKSGKFFKLPKRKSKLVKVMDEKKEEIKNYLDNNDIDLDNKYDVIKIFNYYDSLLTESNQPESE